MICKQKGGNMNDQEKEAAFKEILKNLIINTKLYGSVYAEDLMKKQVDELYAKCQRGG